MGGSGDGERVVVHVLIGNEDPCAVCGLPVEAGTGGSAMGPFPALHTACVVASEDDLVRLTLERRARNEAATGAEMFMGKPNRWHADPHWRCRNRHVSTSYLGSEDAGALCRARDCRAPVYLTFPEDQEGFPL